MKLWIPFAVFCLVASALPAQERSELNPYTSPDDVAVGAKFYRRLCSTCHGQQGEGWPGFAPNLAAYAATDGEFYNVVQNGLPGTDMPAFVLNERRTWQLIGFVRTFAAQVGGATGDPEAGAVVFRESGCVNCHRVGEEGGHGGPDLRAVALIRSPEDLRQSILNPDDSVHPRTFRVRATREDGSTVEGLRLNEDTFSVQIRTSDGRLVALDRTRLQDVEILTDSSMPSYRGRLDDKQVEDLVAYVKSLSAGEPQ